MNDGVFDRPVLTGYKCVAEYTEQFLPSYKGNPLIETLPPIYSPEQVEKLLFSIPDYTSEQRTWPSHVRIHCIQQIKRFMQPLTYNIDIESCFSRVIRDGYVVRNPMSPQHLKQFTVGFSEILKAGLNGRGENITGNRPSASGFSIVGMSGVGKSTAVERTLLLYPQVIQHSMYNGKPFILKQVVWLKLECPGNGSMKALCQNFLRQMDSILGTNYYARHVKTHVNTDNLIIAMSQIASLHGLGVLVIDEVQRLKKSYDSGDNIMLEYFTELVNTIGVPVVVIGTYKSMYLYQSAFAQARRATGQGDQILSNLEETSPEWELFLESLWHLQWTTKKCPLDDELRKVMYQESQGILDIATKLYMNAQWEAILNQSEEITPKLVKRVARKCLKLVKPMLNALKTGDQLALVKYEDLKPEWLTLNQAIKRSKGNVSVFGQESTEHARAIRSENSDETVVKLMNIAIGLGLTPRNAEKLVMDVFNASGGLADPKQMSQQVASLALENVGHKKDTGETIPGDVSARSGRKGKVIPLIPSDDAWFGVYAAMKKGEGCHEALKQAGLLKPPLSELFGHERSLS